MHTAIRRALRRRVLDFETLEDRAVPATAVLGADGTLTVTGTNDDRIRVFAQGAAIDVLDGTAQIGSFSATTVTSLTVITGGGNNTVIIDPNLTLPAVIVGTGGTNKFVAGGGPTTLIGGPGRDVLIGGPGGNTFNGGAGQNDLYNVFPTDVVIPNPGDRILAAYPPGTQANTPPANLTTSDVNTLLERAAAASASTDAIIAIVDRNGNILGVRVESGVDPAITSNVNNYVFAIDGAVSLARTGAFFANNQAPLTSRTVQDLSQSTITEREVNSNPNITDPNSTLAGPGFVAPVGVKAHFPAGVASTPQVDLFQIEHTNRDSSFSNTGQLMPDRFNIDPAFVPAGNTLTPPNSYGFVSGLLPHAQSRGVATLPGGIPIYKNGQLVGGIGVFFPGKTGYATEENSVLSTTFDPTKRDRSLEAEWMAFAAVGGTRTAIGTVPLIPVGDLGGIPLPAGFGLPAGRIDLVGIQLDVFGPGGSVVGGENLVNVGNVVGRGNPFDGTDVPVGAGPNAPTLLAGTSVPSGWLVVPHDGVGITAQDVSNIITAGLIQANKTRAAIRLPLGTRAQFVIAVADQDGNIVGLYRQPDATVFSIDVAVAKARNVAYYANPAELQPIDMVPGVPAGAALTNRTFRFLAEPRFPENIDGTQPAPFSQLNDPGIDPLTGLEIGPPLPAKDYFNTVVGNDAFNPNTNFHQQNNINNQNGIVFFPGSAPLYDANKVLIGGLGVSGDGVDQDDVTTVTAQSGFDAPFSLRADQFIVRGVRLPYQKEDRNPEG